MTIRYCPTHARIWQPAGSETAYDRHTRRLVQVYTPSHWRPFSPVALAWAQHLARQAGCVGEIRIEVRACDRCAATAAPASAGLGERAAPCLDHTHSGVDK